MKATKTIGVMLGLCAVFAQGILAESKPALMTPPEVWKDYDPDAGDFKEEIVLEETKDGIYYRESYISAYVLEEEVRVFCKYAVKAGVKNAPGLMDVHGWMGGPRADMDYVNDGWAVMSHDYSGITNRPQNQSGQELGDWSEAINIGFKPQDGSDITRIVFAQFKWVMPKQTQ